MASRNILLPVRPEVTLKVIQAYSATWNFFVENGQKRTLRPICIETVRRSEIMSETKKMSQSSSLPVVKTPPVYLNRFILQKCFLTWGVNLKNVNLDQSTRHCAESVTHIEQLFLLLDAYL